MLDAFTTYEENKLFFFPEVAKRIGIILMTVLFMTLGRKIFTVDC